MSKNNSINKWLSVLLASILLTFSTCNSSQKKSSDQDTEIDSVKVNPAKAMFPVPAPHSGLKFWWTGICNANTAEINAYQDWAVFVTGDSSFHVDLVSTYLGWEHFKTMADMEENYIKHSEKFKDICINQPSEMLIVLAMGQVPAELSNTNGKRPQTWTEIADGKYDNSYKLFYETLKKVMDGRYAGWNAQIPDRRAAEDLPYSRIILRLNWEWNRPKRGYHHVANGNLADFKKACRRFMEIGREIMPGIRFDCHPTRARYTENGVGYKLSEAIDIQDWDFVGMALHEDVGEKGEHRINLGAIGYDASSPDSFNENDWAVVLFGSGGKSGVEEGDLWGLDDVARLARGNGKGLTMPEWSPQQVWRARRGPSLHGGRDFAEHVWDFCFQNRDILCYEAGFDGPQGKMFPKSLASEDGSVWQWPAVISEKWLNPANRKEY